MLNGKISHQFIIAASDKLKEKAYWLNQLSGEIEKSFFPYDDVQKSPDRFDAGTVKFKYTGPLYEKLVKLSSGTDHGLYVILTAGLVLLLYKYTGKKDIIIGSPIFKQKIKRHLINSMLALRISLEDDRSFKELLSRVKQTINQAILNRNYPHHLLPELLGLPASAADDDFPLFDMIILIENLHDKRDTAQTRVNMTLSFRKNPDDLDGQWEYNPQLYRRETSEGLSAHFKIALENALLKPDSRISHLDILTPEEKKQIQEQFNHTGMDYPTHKLIHELIEEQVERTPHQTALVFGEEKLSYSELNQKANQLASLLREKGVKPGNIIGMMLEHSPDMVIGILGVLKAGAAYLPIDAKLPTHRVRLMLEDSRAPLLLTQNALLGGHPITMIQNLGAGRVKVRRTNPRPTIQNLDLLPITDRSLIDYEKYQKYISMTYGKNSIAMQATRGCPYHCAYCHKIWPKTHAYRSAEHIFKEVQIHYHLGIRRFSFYDDIFNLNKENSREFFQLILKHGLDVQLFFPGGLRGDILSKDYIDLMIEAGTVNVALALETASPRLQKLIKKNLIIHKFRENLEYFCRKYPQVILDLYTMHGFPTETQEEAMMTLDFIKNLQWIHFPAVHILKIYQNTDMEKLALENGISQQSIINSAHLAFHELPETLPFDKDFTRHYQTAFLNDYFLSKERLLHVLPFQMKVLSKDEMVQKYNSYLPTEIKTFDDLLDALNIANCELGVDDTEENSEITIPHLHEKMKQAFPKKVPARYALNILLLDLSLIFSTETDLLYDPVEPPLGLMTLLTYINHRLGSKINGRIAQSRIDFDSYPALNQLLSTFKPDIIGVRTLSKFKDFFQRTVSVIRGWGIEAAMVAGGPYATSEYQCILQDRSIDVVVLGEGEKTFTELVACILENRGKLPGPEVLARIAGIAFVPDREKELPHFAPQILMPDESPKLRSPRNRYTPEKMNPSTELAYVIFTSGSTGKPKGVMVEHKSLVNLCCWHNKSFNVNPSDNSTLYANYCFDASVWELFPYLIKGATLHVLGDPLKIDMEKLNEYYNCNNISISFLPTQVFQRFIQLENSSLRMLLTGADHLKRYRKQRYQLVNNYGPTENTVVATSFTIDKNYVNIPIGSPIANVTLGIFDRHLNLLPVGVSGEIGISGDGLARGYLNQPLLTAEKFVRAVNSHLSLVISSNDRSQKLSPNDQCPMTNDRLYKTGDLAKWLPDGNIEFLGRIDHQVKIRGFRIELGEIESQLLKNRQIKEAVVLVKKNKHNEKHLCAYIVFADANHQQEDTTANSSELKEYLAAQLPDYMLPDQFVTVDRIPLTRSGKTDTKALANIGQNIGTGVEYQPPGNVIETIMVNQWKEVLDVDIVSINDDFFQLGGNSLTAIKLVSKLKDSGIRITVNEIFRYQSIKEMAQYIMDTGNENINPHFIKPISPKPAVNENDPVLNQREFANMMQLKNDTSDLSQHITARIKEKLAKFNETIVTNQTVKQYKLSPIQQSHLRLENRFTSIHISFDKQPDIQLLEEALLELIENQGLLRSTLVKKNGQLLWNEFSSPQRITIPYIDLMEYHPELKEKLISQILDQMPQQISEEKKTVLYRILLIKKDLRNHLLVIALDHLVYDAASLEIIKNNLSNSYHRKERNHNPTTQMPKPKSYFDYIRQISLGPLDINEDELIEIFELEAFCKSKREFEKITREKENHHINVLNYELPFTGGMTEENVWEIAFFVFNLLLKKYFGLSKIPLKILFYGRRYRQNTFFDTVGEFSDLVPVLVHVNEENPANMFADVRHKLDKVIVHNINFMSLMYDDLLKKKWKKAAQFLVPEQLDPNDPMVLFNFVGKTAEEQIRQFKQVGTAPKESKISTLYCEIYYTSNSLFFNISTSLAIDTYDDIKISAEELKRIIILHITDIK